MVDRPILFSAAMVRALLEGRKTQTRRVLDVPPVTFDAVFCDDGVWYIGDAATGRREARLPVRYQAGDRLWVREAWRVSNKWNMTAPRDLPARTMTTFFEAGGGSMGGIEKCPRDRVRTADEYPFDPTYPPVMPDWVGRKRAGMHMPRWASRLTLTVTEVRVQRLQEINEEDAQAEGCIKLKVTGRAAEFTGSQYLGIHWPSCRAWYRELWDSLNVARGFGWDANPWVVAITFTVERRNIDAVAP